MKSHFSSPSFDRPLTITVFIIFLELFSIVYQIMIDNVINLPVKTPNLTR